MNTESKFVISRNNLCYIYVEKYLSNNETFYNVYYDSKAFTLSSDCFQSTYANDIKYSLYDYLTFVETSALSNAYLYDKVEKIITDIKLKDRRNPSLKNKYEFLKLLDDFNEFIYDFVYSDNFSLDDEIDYEEEYQRLIKQEF